MAEEPQEISPTYNLSLVYKVNALSLYDVSVSSSSASSMKTYLKTHWAEPSENPREDITLDLCLGSSPRIPEKDYVSLDLCLGLPNPNPKVTCAPKQEEIAEYARKIKKTRSLSKKERDEENRNGVSTELTLYTTLCTIRKTLTTSDTVDQQNRLMIEIILAECHIVRYLSADDQRRIQEGYGVKVKVYDNDTETEHDLTLSRRINSTKSYVFNGGWVKEFVWRRGLKQGDKIGLLWDCVDSRLEFCVLSRARSCKSEEA